MGTRALVSTVVILLVMVGGLLAWVLLTNPPRSFPAPLAAGRVRPQGGVYVCPVPEPAHLNPFTTRDNVARGYVLGFTHDHLMRLDPKDGKLRPGLADVVARNDDDTCYEFELRAGATFADGAPVTVDDVRFTWEVGQDKTVALGSIGSCLEGIASFEVLGARRFRIALKHRHFTGLAGLATGYVVVQRRWFLDAVAARARAAGVPVPAGPGADEFGKLLTQVPLPGPGSGPYQLAVDTAGEVVWEHGVDLWMVQNPASWHRAACPESWNLAGIRLRFISDLQARYAALRRQAIDFHMADDLEALLANNPDLRQHYRVEKFSTPTAGHYMVVWNHTRKPLADARVRRALTMLFDRERLVRDVFGGSARVAHCWFQPGTLEYTPDLEVLPFEPQKAGALLAEAGYGAGREHGPLSLELIMSNDPRYARIMEIAAPAFRTAGVELKATALEWATYTKRREAGDFDGRIVVWSHDATGVDPYEYFHSAPGGRPNPMHYSDGEVDAWLTAARSELDGARRRALYHRFNRRFVRDQPVTLLVHPTVTLLLHKRFEDAEPVWAGAWPERWWVKPAARRYGLGQPR